MSPFPLNCNRRIASEFAGTAAGETGRSERSSLQPAARFRPILDTPSPPEGSGLAGGTSAAIALAVTLAALLALLAAFLWLRRPRGGAKAAAESAQSNKAVEMIAAVRA